MDRLAAAKREPSERPRRPLVLPQVLAAAELDEALRRAMYALYERYYGGALYARFAADLAEKDRVVLLRDADGELRGFSTLAWYERCFAGEPLRVLFSGDTIVDERHWGQQQLAFAWLRLAGELKAARPALPLYWFLICKGHRTYRYLPAFSREFHPAPGRPVPARERALMDFLARDRFGAHYDAERGVLRFPESRGHLRPAYAEVPEGHRQREDVALFLARNPGYRHGDELVCLCELAAENLQPIARRAFLAGARAGAPR